jgi:hypothetical protein
VFHIDERARKSERNAFYRSRFASSFRLFFIELNEAKGKNPMNHPRRKEQAGNKAILAGDEG